MTIAAAKIDEKTFYDIYDLLEQYQWLKNFLSPLIELWNLCDEKEQQDLLKRLISRFTFIDGFQLDQIAKDIYGKTQEWALNSTNTYISAIADSNEVDGSIAGLQFIKNKFPSTKGWKERNFYSSITEAATKINTNDNIILFDDFIGTGKTMINKINYVVDKYKERSVKPNSIKIVSYAAMEFGVRNVHEKYDYEIYTPLPLKRGLTDFETQESLEKKKVLMISLESKLGKKFRRLKLTDHSLGYRGSETLFQICGYNCPNNLFPVFWWPTLEDGTERNTIFQRIR